MTAKNEGIEFVDEKERELFARARLGVEVEDFLMTNVGRYLHGRAKIEMQQAEKDALESDPDTFWGRRKLRKAREKARCARNFVVWCADAIVDGKHADQELSQHRG